MARRYILETKIKALNMIDQNDGDVSLASTELHIPARTLQNWRSEESNLRRQYQERQQRRARLLAADLRLRMLQRGQEILAQMHGDALQKAPLNQLATALGALVSNALKLEDVIGQSDEQDEKVIRFEHFYDGSLHQTPPWAGASEGFDRSLQGSGVWEALGQDRIGQADPDGDGAGAETLLVAGADAPDGEPGLARFEGDHAANGRHRHQRDRTPH